MTAENKTSWTDPKRLKNLFFSITLKKVLFGLIILGIFLRIFVFFTFSAAEDANYYTTLGRGFAEKGGPYMPFGDLESNSLEPTHSPSTKFALPLYLSFFYVILGYSFTVTKVAMTILSFLTLIVIYYTTKDLYGKDIGLTVTALVSMISTLIQTTGILYFENLTYLLLAIGLWGFLKGGKFFPIGMLSISVFYISRSYSLALYILCICLFYSWLFYTERKKVFDKYHLIALVCTVPFIFILYHSSLNSDYATSNISILDAIFEDPAYMTIRYFQLLGFFLLYTLGFAIYFYKPLKHSFSVKNLLWIVLIGLILGSPLAQAYQNYVYHFYYEIASVRKASLRTIFYITLPLLWIVIPKLKCNLDEKLRFKEIWKNLKDFQGHKQDYRLFILMGAAIGGTVIFIGGLFTLFPLILGFVSLFFKPMKWKIAILCLMLVLVSVNDNTRVYYEYHRRLGEDLNELMDDGDVIMFDGINFIDGYDHKTKIDRYLLAPYVTKDYKLVNRDSNETPDFILTKNDTITFENYTILKRYYTQDKLGIIHQAFDAIYRAIKNPGPPEKQPLYVLWVKE